MWKYKFISWKFKSGIWYLWDILSFNIRSFWKWFWLQIKRRQAIWRMEKRKRKGMGLGKIIFYKEIEGTHCLAEFFEKCIWKGSFRKK